MSIDTFPDRLPPEAQLERFAEEGDVQALIDRFAYDGYTGDRERMKFVPVDTYHEGVVHLGGDIARDTIPLNNGQMIIVPRDEGANSTVLRVETNRGRRGKAVPVLASYHISGVMGSHPEVEVDEKQPLVLGQGMQLDMADFGFIKALRSGDTRTYGSRSAQRVMEGGRMTRQQKVEFGIVGASLRALEGTGLFVR